MGFFDSLKGIADAVKQGAAMAKEAELNAPVAILNPTPQAEIDAGAQRAVLLSASYQNLEQGEHVGSMAVTLQLRARLAGGELGPPTALKVRMSSRAAQQLRRGQELAASIDPDGTVTAVVLN